ncbi:MAG: hypothetical protein H6832_14490 [Planctomycetes bacterium]|nr:hypothetical protein [Planctomycetota bacterium]
MKNRNLLLTLPMLAGIATAQTAPGVARAEAAVTALSAITSPGNINFVKLPGDGPGVWTGSATSGTTLLIGKYDQANGTWTATTEAAALNPDSGNFGLMLDQTGKYCVFDRADAVYFSSRSGPGVAFAAPVKVTGVPGGYVDPALCYNGGKLQIIWTTGSSIMMQELDVSVLSAPTVVGTAAVIANRTQASGSIHSPSPVVGPDGDIEGLFCAESTGTDLYFKAGIDPADAPILMADYPSWANNGGIAGAHFVYVRSAAIQDFEAGWLTGDVEATAGTVDIGAAAPSKSGKALTLVFLSDTVVAPVTLPAPFDVGALGLNASVFIMLGAIAHTTADQTGSISFKLPNDPLLKGKIAIQGLSFDTASAFPYTWAWTNTAHIVVQ